MLVHLKVNCPSPVCLKVCQHKTQNVNKEKTFYASEMIRNLVELTPHKTM